MRKLLILAALSALFAFTPRHKAPWRVSGTVMTMPYTITLGDSASSWQKWRVERAISRAFTQVDRHFNGWNSDSEISRINHAEAMTEQPLSAELAELLSLVEEMHEISEGRFDPTVGPIKRLWIKALREGRTPSLEEISRHHTGWKQEILLGKKSITKRHQDVEIDLDGIAKGAGVDLLVKTLRDVGVRSALVEWGGEIFAWGAHPEGRPWQIAIRSPEGSAEPIATVSVAETALATSGDYLQVWRVEGRAFTHIIDGSTRTPLEIASGSISSATVEANSCARADALATTCLLFGKGEEAARFLADLGANGWIATHCQSYSPSDHEPVLRP